MKTSISVIILVFFILAFRSSTALAYAGCTTPDPSGCETKPDGRCCTDIICWPPPNTPEWHCGSACAGKCGGGGDDDDGGCSNDCSPSGSTRCTENRTQTCGNYDGDSCLEWSGVTTNCTYGCSGDNCANPDNDKVLCESEDIGGIWMPQGTDGGKCCGDDPSNSPVTVPDSGRVLANSTLLNPESEWLCTVPPAGPAVTQSAGRRGEVMPIPGMASDALSSDNYWYICDSNKNSDGNDSDENGEYDHKYDRNYDWWDGRRVDDTCRYTLGGFFCGEIQGVQYAKQRPVVELEHDYVCITDPGTDPELPSGPLTGERFVECCGSNECFSGQGLSTGGKVRDRAGGTTWVCADDNRFHDQSEINTDPVLCELLGYIWSGDSCCNGEENEDLIWSWRGEEVGCCYESSPHCLVDNDGSPTNNGDSQTYFTTGKGPHCIASGQFVLNHLCDELADKPGTGVWRSRNKGLADKLLKIVKGIDKTNYVLFCDDYENALAYYKYVTSMNNPLEESFFAAESCSSGSKDYPCFNTFCVAAVPDAGFAVVGGSVNYPKNVSHVEELTGEPKGACNPALGKSGYHKCSSGLLGGAKLWFADDEGGFIYSTEEISVSESGLWADIKSAFDTLILWVAGNKYSFAEEVMEKADTYERFYVLESGGKSVFGREEGLYHDGVFDGVLALDFKGFSPELCNHLNQEGGRFEGSCTPTGDGTQYVAAARSAPEHVALFELWQYLTSSLRASPQLSCPQEGEMCGGIAGIWCCAGLTCEMEDPFQPDATGICTKKEPR